MPFRPFSPAQPPKEPTTPAKAFGTLVAKGLTNKVLPKPAQPTPAIKPTQPKL